MCKYCVNKGRIPKEGELEKYYDEYLPAMIESYREIIENCDLESWFFGGGTPSLIDSERLEKLLSSLPRFSEGEKTFEIHPAIWDADQLDVLAKYGFHNIIIGIQTFDEDTLDKQNRIAASKETVAELSQEIKKRGMNVCADIIGFLNERESDKHIFRDDIETCYQLKVDQVSLNTSFSAKKNFDRELIREVVQSNFFWSKKYISEIERYEKHCPQDLDYLTKWFENMKGFRFFSKKLAQKNLFGKEITNRMEAARVMAREVDKRAVLGIGSYKNKALHTYSTLSAGGTETEIIEINRDWTPRFFVTFERDFFQELEDKIAQIKECGEPPPAVGFNIRKTFRTFNQESTQREYQMVSIKARDCSVHPRGCKCQRCWDAKRYIKKINSLFK